MLSNKRKPLKLTERKKAKKRKEINHEAMECGAHSESYLRNHMHGCGLAARDTVFLKPGPWSTYDRRELCSRQGVEDKPMALRIELKLQTTGIIWRACQRHAGEPHPQYFSPVGLGRSRQFASLPNRAEASTEDPTRVENCCFRESPKPHLSVCSVKYQFKGSRRRRRKTS